MKTTVLALAVFTGISTASPVANTNIESLNIQYPADSSISRTIDISGVRSEDEKGSLFNQLRGAIFPTSGYQITGVSWDLTISTVGSSLLSEASIRLMNPDGHLNPDTADSFSFAPGIGFPSSGTMHFVGSIDIAALGEDFITTDTVLFIEFFESFDNATDMTDAIYQGGSSLTIYAKLVPAPGSLALLGFGSLVATRRRRTTHAF